MWHRAAPRGMPSEHESLVSYEYVEDQIKRHMDAFPIVELTFELELRFVQMATHEVVAATTNKSSTP
jgi:hypothetical protein